jgi:hypothetical protein
MSGVSDVPGHYRPFFEILPGTICLPAKITKLFAIFVINPHPWALCCGIIVATIGALILRLIVRASAACPIGFVLKLN